MTVSFYASILLITCLLLNVYVCRYLLGRRRSLESHHTFGIAGPVSVGLPVGLPVDRRGISQADSLSNAEV